MARAVMSDFVICPARPADIEAMRRIERRAAALFAATPGYEFCVTAALRDEAEHQHVLAVGRTFLALAEDGAPAGFAMLQPLDGEAHLVEIDVDPDYQRRGLARRLIEEACAWAVSRSLRAMTLTTYRDIPWNAPYYARLGFVAFEPDADRPSLLEVIKREKDWGFAFAPRIAMRKTLP